MRASRCSPGAASDENSRRTRVQPVFGWLAAHGEPDRPARLIALADGWPGCSRMRSGSRRATVAAGAKFEQRVITNPQRDAARRLLETGDTRIPPRLKLEGATHADCLIETACAVISIEGKRNDWPATVITWDAVRDQLARNAEAAHLVAASLRKRSLVIGCHEHPLKHHEQALLDGYRAGTCSAGWPHLDEALRRRLGAAMGTVTWERLAAVGRAAALTS